MQIELLSPSMQDGKEADPGLQIFPERSDFGENFGGGLEQQVVDHGLVLKRERPQLAGQREDDMKILHRQQIFFPVFEPLRPQAGLALGAVPIAT